MWAEVLVAACLSSFLLGQLCKGDARSTCGACGAGGAGGSGRKLAKAQEEVRDMEEWGCYRGASLVFCTAGNESLKLTRSEQRPWGSI